MKLLAAITALFVGNLAPDAVPVKDLAKEVLKVSRAHQVDPLLVARIIVVESRGRANAKNSRTDDYGLMQINKATQIAYGVSDDCMKDWKCNLDAGVKILSDMLKMKGSRPCMYNVGPRGRFEKYKTACEKYEVKIASVEPVW